MDNAYYATILSEVAMLLQIQGANRYKVRAFEHASNALTHLLEPVSAMIAQDRLTEIQGVGASIAAEIKAIAKHGTCPTRTALLEELDEGLLDLFKVQGLGPKRLKTLYDELGVSNLEALRRAAETGQIKALKGFGAKTEANLLREAERLQGALGRTPLPAALQIAGSFCDLLAARDDVDRVAIAGSLRRQSETVGDIDLLVVSRSEPAPIFEAFVATPGVTEVLAQGDVKCSVRTVQRVQLDLRLVRPEHFASALHYFTGSKAHHVKLRALAKRQGLKINEYGVFPLSSEEALETKSEEAIYAALGLDFIPPELRHGHDEIARAERGELPALIELNDVRGDLHMHTVASDGEASIAQMAEAAKAIGYEYIAITDHSPAVVVANGLDARRFAAHIEAIREHDAEIEGIRLLSGLEVDILRDGSLDMDHDLLRECDWVVGSVHMHQKLPEAEMTARLLRAVETGLLSCLGHPTGRILGGRAGYAYDLERVFAACVEHGVAMEINGSRGRLDFNAEHAAKARAAGVKLTLGSDAHSTRGLNVMPLALGQARRAGLEREDVLNCLPVGELLGRTRPALR